jgi:hypothetical protein
MSYFQEKSGFISRTIIIFLIILLIVPGFVQRASGTAWLIPLKFLAHWLFGRVMDGVVDKYLLRKEIGRAKEGISDDKERAMRELRGKEREEMLKAIESAQRAISELEDYINTHQKMTDQELLNHCERMLEEKIIPIYKEVRAIEMRLKVVEEKVTTLADDINRFKAFFAEGAKKGFVDRDVLGESIEEVKTGITFGKEIAMMEIDNRRSMWEVLEEAEKLIIRFDNYIKTHEMTDQELIEYYNRMLKDEMEPLNWRIRVVEIEMDSLKKEIEKLKTFKVRPVFGVSYQGYGLRNDSWKERYKFLPFEADEENIFHGSQLSLGLWVNRTVYFEGNVHYMGKQSKRIRKDDFQSYDLTMQGMGISGTGVLTIPFPKLENCLLEVGAGYLRDKYRVGYKKITEGANIETTNEIAFRRLFEDPLGVVGFRYGRETFSALGRLECMVRGWDIKGYYLRFAVQYIL